VLNQRGYKLTICGYKLIMHTVSRIAGTFLNHRLNTIRFLNNIMLIIVIQLCPVNTLNDRE